MVESHCGVSQDLAEYSGIHELREPPDTSKDAGGW
jgi:hypothetical protein